ncbi:dethiobiotin synthase [Helicobacter trogontum]|uniref:ATP-dependent dethiobiotin synthetase BioD n=1 Tax=Helicobacter trogontum TaxID=50960 RepID=A0A4U8TFC2_9HELI|nr:dethiobiotin synthase [Helicobacter trogontum]MCI5787300.1 dethiobiotin synthase [Helicobacter trogontum]MDY5186017.1 dethiobiotin synthase [Helicobacter trogontum]TLD98374.1 dethiobiotin synthase [Helicobacter trogontum]
MQIYISGIHTDVGKTHVSAAFCSSFNYAYFKLIQAGTPKDCDIVQNFDSNIEVLGEGICLKTPASPHIAKLQENLHYKGLDIVLPTQDNVVIELAGGLFSPIDEHVCMLDYMQHYKRPTILVGTYYLGAINHIILSIKALRQCGIKILCLVMNGVRDLYIDKFIYDYTGINIVHLDTFDTTNFTQSILNFKYAMQPYMI